MGAIDEASLTCLLLPPAVWPSGRGRGGWGYLLGISLPLHLVYIAVFGVAFPYFSSLWSSLYCGLSLLWVGLDGWLVKVSWLWKLVSVFWWVELDFFSLECNEVSSNEL